MAIKEMSFQKLWKNISVSFSRGFRDQILDFNRPVLDDIPASWQIKARII
jgi:hypothetical protein